MLKNNLLCCVLMAFLLCFSLDTYAQISDYTEATKRVNLSEKKLNAIYQEVLKEYAKNLPFIKNLRISQKAWLASRKADLLMKYPESDTDRCQMLWGTIYPICANDFNTDYNNQRIKYLKQWLKSEKLQHEECGGSIHDFLNKY